MIQKYLCKFFAHLFYPTKSRNWYKEKGYLGSDEIEEFAKFISTQKKPVSHFYNEFKDVEISRQYIKSGKYLLDSVIISPNKKVSLRKPCKGLYFVMFYGKGEYYESCFRSASIQAIETGASILCFNPKGLNQSTGNTEKIMDIVCDGISVIDFLIKKGVSEKNIILQGNSIGAAIMEMVSQHYKKNRSIIFRQINSNSFRNLSAVISYYCKMPFLEKPLNCLVEYSGWGFIPGDDFFQTSIYRCYMRRKNDRTILPGAEYHAMIDHEKDYGLCPDYYKNANKWLNKNNQLIYIGDSDKDPHDISLHHFKISETNKPKKRNVYYFINYYIIHTQDYI